METNTNINCLRQLLDEDINRLMSAEAQLKTSLTGWISKDCAPPLKALMHHYLDIIENHQKAIDAFCLEEQLLSINSSNQVMKAMTDELSEKLDTCSCPPVKDACLLAGVQTICHFKICTYGTAAAFAGAAGLEKAAAIFHQAEQDEKSIDRELSHLAAHEINPKALAPVLLTE